MAIRSRFKPGMTAREFIRAYLPDADDDFADWILWERTAWPVADAETVERQVRAFVRAHKRRQKQAAAAQGKGE